ncbi:hypothetical protein BKA70DRAFT_1564558 [Coprinopsis sp. MPI-PUGE-AT-0042]|nr:hypothetical protein BKA70DRAFT_1564558 [Coprinopsis sp. MPI-PUGE-AT-0042]
MAHLQRTVNARVVICSIDIGNSTSSVSFLYAEGNDHFKDLKNKVYRAHRWPGHVGDNVSIPSQLCYLNGKPCLYGANAREPGRNDKKKWVLVKSFKRHVNSLDSITVPDPDRAELLSFPPGVTLRGIYKDWTSFLFSAASKAFLESRNDAAVDADLWRKRICVFVVPNGWTESQHAYLRELLRDAGCVEDCNNVRFARESEADLHYGLFLGLEMLTRPVDLSFFICNVGESTGDLGFYKIIKIDPLHYAEVEPAESFPVPATNVDGEVTTSGDQDAAPDENSDEDNMDPVYNVVKHVNKFRQGISGDAAPKYIVLEGGGLDKVSRERISTELPDITVLTLSDASSSELSVQGRGLPTVDGALYSCIYNFITARKAPYCYGCAASVPFDKSNDDHKSRRDIGGLRYIAGRSFVPYAWETIVSLDELIKDGDGKKKDFTIHFRERPSGLHRTTVVVYATKELNPQWVFESHGRRLCEGVREVCTIKADIDTHEMKVAEKQLVNGQKSFAISYTLDINFGSITSSATVSWKKSTGTMGSMMATFSPPDDIASDWHTNEDQGDQEDVNNGSDKGQGKTPQDNPGKEENPPLPRNADDRAKISSGIYTIANPSVRHRRGGGQACWDFKNHLFREIRCRTNYQGDETEWLLKAIAESTAFTLGPNLGSAKARQDHGYPLTGYEKDQPYKNDRVLAWQTDSTTPKRWYAIQDAKLRGDNYRIVSELGSLAWTIATAAEGNRDYLEVSLQNLDTLDDNQVWELVRVPPR